MCLASLQLAAATMAGITEYPSPTNELSYNKGRASDIHKSQIIWFIVVAIPILSQHRQGLPSLLVATRLSTIYQAASENDSIASTYLDSEEEIVYILGSVEDILVGPKWFVKM